MRLGAIVCFVLVGYKWEQKMTCQIQSLPFRRKPESSRTHPTLDSESSSEWSLAFSILYGACGNGHYDCEQPNANKTNTKNE